MIEMTDARKPTTSPLVLALVVSAVLFVVYACLAARDVMFGDGIALTGAALTDGLAGPPGYPLWIMLAHLASMLPFGAPVYQINLTSALYHAITSGLVFYTAYLLTRQRRAALFAAVVLAIGSPIFVSWSLQAEVFALNDLFAAAIVLLCVLWVQDGRRFWLALPLAGLFGLGLANHHTIIALGPLPLWVAFTTRRYLRPTKTVLKAVFFSIGVLLVTASLPYLHIVLASQHNTYWSLGQAHTPGELLDVVDRHAFGTFHLVPSPEERGGTILERIQAMLAANGWPASLILLGTLAFARQRRWQELGLVILIIAIPGLLFCAIADINVNSTIALAIFQRFSLLWLVAAAPYAAGIFLWLKESVNHQRLRNLLGIFLIACFAIKAAIQLPRFNLSNVHDPRLVFRDISNALPKNAILETCGDAINGDFAYFGPIEHWRPDVTVIIHGYLFSSGYRDELAKDIPVPAEVGSNVEPAVSRDFFIEALSAAHNPRPFYVSGDRPLHAAGPQAYAIPEGIVSRMVPLQSNIDLKKRYATEVALESQPGYAQVYEDRWLSNGFGDVVREYYAGGFFTTAYDAERLGKIGEARRWYQIAAAYSPDQIILDRLRALPLKD